MKRPRQTFYNFTEMMENVSDVFVNKRWIFFFAEAAGGALFLVAFFLG